MRSQSTSDLFQHGGAFHHPGVEVILRYCAAEKKRKDKGPVDGVLLPTQYMYYGQYLERHFFLY